MSVPMHFIQAVRWGEANSAPYKCGAMGERATTDRADVTCSDCLTLMRGVGVPTPLHQPPAMNENGDGIFTFYDVDYHHPDPQFRQRIPLEVVPQTTGNVEMVLAGVMLTLSHLDRADLIRALLHDFHYSPERGGPNDDDN